MRAVFNKLVEYCKKKPTAFSGFAEFYSIEGDLAEDRAFLLTLYGQKSRQNCNTLDQLLYVSALTTDRAAALLTPTEDSFQQHVRRACYQASLL